MNPLELQIRDKIKLHGHITVDDFMSMTLFDPNNGYYITKDPIGEKNDFITSPEISVLFGETIAAFIITQVREKLEKYDRINLIEIGAGKGTLFNDILNTCSKYNDVYQKISGYILEINPILVEKQRSTLINHIDTVKWINNLNEIDSPSPHLYICNEFFDALPVKQYIKSSETIFERIIKIDAENNFVFDKIPASIPQIILNDSDEYNDGAIIEYSEPQITFMKTICDNIFTHKGFAIIIDYGYADFVTGDTLQSVYQHKYNNIFQNIGDADLTTQINFRLLYNVALEAGLNDLYLQTQGDFLKSMGIQQRLQRLSAGLGDLEKNDLFLRVNRLINSSQMGSLFKCMVAEKF